MIKSDMATDDRVPGDWEESIFRFPIHISTRPGNPQVAAVAAVIRIAAVRLISTGVLLFCEILPVPGRGNKKSAPVKGALQGDAIYPWAVPGKKTRDWPGKAGNAIGDCYSM
jgi:hypothetical protein